MKAYVNDAPMMKIKDRGKEKFVLWLFCDFVALILLELSFESWNINRKKEHDDLYNELNTDLFVLSIANGVFDWRTEKWCIMMNI